MHLHQHLWLTPSLQRSHVWPHPPGQPKQCTVLGTRPLSRESWGTRLSDPCRAAPNGWIQGPVVRVSFLPLPSQSWVTASTPRAPPPYVWSLETHCSAPAKVNPVPSPSRMGVRESLLTWAVHIHTLPPSPYPLGCGPHGNPPSPCPKPHLTPGHAALGAPAHPTQYLRGSSWAGGRGWRGEGPARPRTPRQGPGPGSRAGPAAAGGREALGLWGRGRWQRAHPPPPCPRARLGGERPPGQGEEGAVRRRRRSRLAEPGLAPPPATPQAPPLFKDPSFPRFPLRSPASCCSSNSPLPRAVERTLAKRKLPTSTAFEN